MLANACEGGDSVIVDGFAVVERLRLERPEMLDVLCAVPVPFRLFSDDNETYSINPMIELDSAGEIARPRYSNQTTQAVPLSEPRSADFYGAYHELAARINDDGVKDSLRLEGGEILMVAGHRVLHARRPIISAGRRHLRDAYFEHDNVRNHLAVLRRTGRI